MFAWEIGDQLMYLLDNANMLSLLDSETATVGPVLPLLFACSIQSTQTQTFLYCNYAFLLH